jgi:hypothetical protein
VFHAAQCTPESHPDHAAVSRALALVSAAATHINEAVRDREAREEIVALQGQFAPGPDGAEASCGA